MTHLVAACDLDFAWMLDGQGVLSPDGLSLPPGGVDDPLVIAWVRKLTADLLRAGCRGSWLIVAGGEVVGLCSYKAVPGPDGEVEIGYGVAPSRRGLGHATRAVAALLPEAAADPLVRTVTAETTADNVASHLVLQRAGFLPAGNRVCEEEGPLIRWRVSIRQP